MTVKEIQELIKLINKSNLSEFKLKEGEFELTIRTSEYQKNKHQAPQAVGSPTPIIPIPPVQQSFIPPAQAPAAQAAPEKPAVEEKTEKPAASSSDLLEIRSPIVGTFYRSSSPEKPPYIKVGDTVEAGQVVCIVEAMKLFNEIESEISGKVVKVVTEDAQPVEYDQVLFLVDPKG